MGLCESAGPFDFQNSCIRASWSSLIPATLVFALYLWSLPLPNAVRKITKVVKTPFTPFLTLEEAEALDSSADIGAELKAPRREQVVNAAVVWRTGSLVFVGLAEALSWLSFASYNLINDSGTAWMKTLPFFVAFTWIYTVTYPLFRPVVTVPLRLFYVYFLLLCSASFQLGSIIYDYTVLDVPLPSPFLLTALLLNLAAVLGLLAVVLAVPFAIPGREASKEDVVSA